MPRNGMCDADEIECDVEVRMDNDQCRQKLEESQKKLCAISRRLVGCNEGRHGEQVLASVSELQALAAWIGRSRGAEERQREVMPQKLQQLQRIRKELERSAIESQHSRCCLNKEDRFPLMEDLKIQTTERNCDISKSSQHGERLNSDVSPIDYFSSDQIEDKNSNIYFDCCGNECPISEQIVDRNRNLNIDFVSAKNEIQKLTLGIEREILNDQSFLSESTGPMRKESDSQPDSLGTAMSEDEGLGEESRRGDSAGPSSLLEIRDSVADLIAGDASSSEIIEPNLKGNDNLDRVDRIEDFRDPRNSLELCLCTIAKLKESLNSKEQELLRLAAATKDKSENVPLQNVILNLQQNMEELQLSLRISEKANSSLKEQVLELEEAENDARLQGQRLEEKLVFLQEKDSHFQTELAEMKHAFEMCVEELSVKDTEELELRSQLKYMEVLVQKYEDQIRTMENTESALRNELLKHEEREIREKLNVVSNVKCRERGTQTYVPNFVNTTVCNSSEQSKAFCDNHEPNFDESMYSVSNSLSTQQHEQLLSSNSNNVGTFDTFHQTCSCNKRPCEQLSHGLGEMYSAAEATAKLFINVCTQAGNATVDYEAVDSVTQTDNAMAHFNEERDGPQPSTFSRYDSTNDPCEGSVHKPDRPSSLTCPVQKELLRRLHHLLQEDADLQQQLHHVDQINLTLWQKLHSLQSHIGECKRKNMSEDDVNDSDDASSLSVCLSFPLKNNPLNDQNSFSDENLRYECECLSHEFLTSLDYNEEKLRERLMQLEEINSSFEKELDMREKLYYERERKHEEWDQTENSLKNDLKTLGAERDCLLVQVRQLESEKLQLASRVGELQLELAITREKHKQEASRITTEREEMTTELQNHIEQLLFREKDHLRHIANLKSQNKKFVDKKDFEKLKTSYVDVQIELNGCRDKIERLKCDFEDQLESLSRNHAFEETRLLNELETLQQRYSACDGQLRSTQLLQSELENAVKEKEQWLEDARAVFNENMMSAEKKYRSMEAELKTKLQRMEDETAMTTKALTEERTRLENELQENIDDLRCRESGYEARIAELEGDLTELQEDLRRAEGSHCEEELLELRQSEDELRAALVKMERREGAYRTTLARANGMVTALERGYRDRVEELKASERGLRSRVAQLEAHRPPTPLDVKEQLRNVELAHVAALQQTQQLEKVRERLKTELRDREKAEQMVLCQALTTSDPLAQATSHHVTLDHKQNQPGNLDLEKQGVTQVSGSLEAKCSDNATCSTLIDRQEPRCETPHRFEPLPGGTKRTSIVTETTSDTEVLKRMQNEENNIIHKRDRLTSDIDAKKPLNTDDVTSLSLKEVHGDTILGIHGEEDIAPRHQTKDLGDWSRHQLEECMVRAMDAMRRDIQGLSFPPNNRGNENESGEVILPPFNFRVVQQVGSDTVLVGWEYSRTSSLEGFEVYVDGQLHESVHSPDRTKAVIGGLDLGRPLTLGLCAVASGGRASEPQALRLHPEGPFCFQEEDEDGDLFDDDPSGKQPRPYSMEW